MLFEKFLPKDTVMLLIDHQIGTMGWVKSTTFEEMKKNTIMLAKTASILNIPVILTSNMEQYAQGLLLEELKTILPEAYEQRIKRLGIVNAMEDENFAAAVKSTGRKKIIIAGVTNDVCTVYPSLTLVSEGFEVQVVADAGGSPTSIADDMALRRMEKNGVTLTSTNQVIAEITSNWNTPEGMRIIQEVIMPTL
jgi:nicotinamidase-related amidase